MEHSGGKTIKLASGIHAFAAGEWHRLALRFDGANIRASVDGALMANVKDERRKAGLAAIGCGWHKAQFIKANFIMLGFNDKSQTVGEFCRHVRSSLIEVPYMFAQVLSLESAAKRCSAASANIL